MVSPNPTCLVNGSSTMGGANVTASSTVTIALQSTSGVTAWSILCTSTNDLVNQPVSGINATLVVNQVAKTATFTAPSGTFAGLQFTSLVNNGVDVNGTSQSSYSTTFGVWVLTHTNRRVLFVGEKTEGDPVNGWVADINALIENDTSGPGSAGLGLFYNTGSFNVGLDTNGNITTPGAYIQLSNTLTWASGAVSLRSSNSSLSVSANNGVSINSAFTVQSGALTYMSGIASPTINQTTTAVNNATGNPLTIQAQNATGTTSYGGNLLLYSGTGTSNAGNVAISVGSTLAATYSPSGLAWSTNAVSFVPGASNPTINQATVATNSATGAQLTLQSQSASGTTSTGGGLLLASGTGTSFNGNVQINVGNTTNTVFGTTGVTMSLATLAWSSTTASPSLTQVATNVASTNGQTLLIQAQNANGTGSNGGNIELLPGTGTAANGNIALFGTGSFGSGTFVLYIANASSIPSTNPSGGGILYVTGGALKYRGSSGTVSNIASA